MNDGAAPKPRRKLWRWLALVPIAPIVAIAAWWYWPSEDPRFVGRWTFGPSPDSTKARLGVIERWANGTLRQYDGAGKLLSTRRWSVSGDKYRDGFPTAYPDKFKKSIDIENWLFASFHLSFAPKLSEYTIISVDEDLIHLQHIKRDEYYIRLRE